MRTFAVVLSGVLMVGLFRRILLAVVDRNKDVVYEFAAFDRPRPPRKVWQVIALALLSSIARPTRDTQVERYALPILLRMIGGIDVLTFEVT